MSVQGDTLRNLRCNRGLTQSQLSEATAIRGFRVAVEDIATIEAGKRTAPAKTLIALATALEVNPNGLLEARLADQRRRAPMNAFAPLISALSLRRARAAVAALAAGATALGSGIAIERAVIAPDAGAAIPPPATEVSDALEPRRSAPRLVPEPPPQTPAPPPSLAAEPAALPETVASPPSVASPGADVDVSLPGVNAKIVPPSIELPPSSVELPPSVDVVDQLPPLLPDVLRIAAGDIGDGLIP
jgi:transcriptional regulator with XRE-family HTH domain